MEITLRIVHVGLGFENSDDKSTLISPQNKSITKMVSYPFFQHNQDARFLQEMNQV